MDGGAVEGGVIDIRNGCSKYMLLAPGDSVWDECGLYRLKKCPFCGNYPDWNYEEDVNGDLEWTVRCQQQVCHVKPATTRTDSVEYAALKWNTRGTKRRKKEQRGMRE